MPVVLFFRKSPNSRPSSPVPPQGVGVAQGGACSPLKRGGARERAQFSPEAAGRRRELRLADFATPQEYISLSLRRC